jgi:hypothetical protein
MKGHADLMNIITAVPSRTLELDEITDRLWGPQINDDCISYESSPVFPLDIPVSETNSELGVRLVSDSQTFLKVMAIALTILFLIVTASSIHTHMELSNALRAIKTNFLGVEVADTDVTILPKILKTASLSLGPLPPRESVYVLVDAEPNPAANKTPTIFSVNGLQPGQIIEVAIERDGYLSDIQTVVSSDPSPIEIRLTRSLGATDQQIPRNRGRISNSKNTEQIVKSSRSTIDSNPY